jgi:hypothetical protein
MIYPEGKGAARNHPRFLDLTFLEAVSETDLAAKTSYTTGNSLSKIASRKVYLKFRMPPSKTLYLIESGQSIIILKVNHQILNIQSQQADPKRCKRYQTV